MIDGSCDSVTECDRRRTELEEKQIQYVTMAIAGSDDDARKGPAFLVSGAKETFDAIEPTLSKVAAKVNDRPCVGLVGSGSSAAFVKMLVDGLELGECELLAEQYDLQRQMRLNNTEMSETFSAWNQGEQASFLLATTATILAKKDCDVDGCKPSDNFLVDRIVDQAPAKRCSADVPGESVAANTSGSVLSSAMFARFASSSREERSKGGREGRLRRSERRGEGGQVRLESHGPAGGVARPAGGVRVRASGAVRAGVRAAGGGGELATVGGEEERGGARAERRQRAARQAAGEVGEEKECEVASRRRSRRSRRRRTCWRARRSRRC